MKVLTTMKFTNYYTMLQMTHLAENLHIRNNWKPVVNEGKKSVCIDANR